MVVLVVVPVETDALHTDWAESYGCLYACRETFAAAAAAAADVVAVVASVAAAPGSVVAVADSGCLGSPDIAVPTPTYELEDFLLQCRQRSGEPLEEECRPGETPATCSAQCAFGPGVGLPAGSFPPLASGDLPRPLHGANFA